MDGVRHVIKQITSPRVSSEMASYDVASTIHRCLPVMALAVSAMIGVSFPIL